MSKIIKNEEDVKLIISKYEWLKDRVSDLIDYTDKLDEILSIEFSDDDLTVYFTTYYYCYGECNTEHCNDTFPIAWLFLNDEELEKAKKEKKEAEEEVIRKQKELNEILKKQAQEQKEREEYERLKAKFEK